MFEVQNIYYIEKIMKTMIVFALIFVEVLFGKRKRKWKFYEILLKI